MPLLKINPDTGPNAWGLWHIVESEEELIRLAGEASPEELTHPRKKLEWLAGRSTVKAIAQKLGLNYSGVGKDEHGKPSLINHPHSVSLSHSFPYVAAQVSGTTIVGIDLEQPKEKMRKVGPRIMIPSEWADAGNDLVKLCVYWCAKECLFKIHGTRNLLSLRDLAIKPFTLASSGLIHGVIPAKVKMNVTLRYTVTNDFVLVYTEKSARV